jgi:Ca2+-binding RTX toxin-like protein
MFERLEQRILLTAELKPDGTLEVTGTDGADNIRLMIAADQLIVRDDAGDTPFNLADVTAVHVRAGAGDDHVQLDPGVPFAELEGEGGDDTLIGGDSDDTLEGGAGNDVLDGKGGRDVLDGGADFDTADYRFRTEDLVISLNDAPDDGANGGAEGDNVRSNVERVVGGSGNDLIVGSDADNSISTGDGNDTVLGGLGNDSLDGGNGDDWLIGEQGDDRITGGPGQDLMEGRSGNDTFVAAQDGQRDSLEGGTGTDTADSIDAGLDVVNDVENSPSTSSGEITVLRGLNELVDGKSVVDFGFADRGDPSATRTFTVRNDGDTTLRLDGLQVPDGFALVEGLSGSLDPGQSDTFTIRIDTDTLGDKNGTVRISNSAGRPAPECAGDHGAAKWNGDQRWSGFCWIWDGSPRRGSA